jgi:hypothetical protein
MDKLDWHDCQVIKNPHKNKERVCAPLNAVVMCADGCLLGWFWHEDESEPIWQDSRLAKELGGDDDAIWNFKFCPYCGRNLST